MLVTYAVGDVHGALHKLQSLIARCEAHADGRPRKYVFLGDYIDRGPQSADVVRLLVALQAEMPSDVVALMGNHEATLLAAYRRRDAGGRLALAGRSGDAAKL